MASSSYVSVSLGPNRLWALCQNCVRYPLKPGQIP